MLWTGFHLETYLTVPPLLVRHAVTHIQGIQKLARLVDNRILLRLNHLVVIPVLMVTDPLCWGWGWGRVAIISTSGSGDTLIWCSFVRMFFSLLTNRSFNF